MLSHDVFNSYLGRVQHAAEYLAGGSIVLPAKKSRGWTRRSFSNAGHYWLSFLSGW